MNGRLNHRDRLFIRLAANGIAIADSAIWRKTIPRGQGRWKDITEAVLGCCSTTVPTQDSYVIFQGASGLDADSAITAISFPGYSWTGTIEAGDILVVPLPYNFDETITVTALVTTAAMAYDVSTIHGDGTIGTDGVVATDADPQTFTLTVTSTPGSQYLVTLTDD